MPEGAESSQTLWRPQRQAAFHLICPGQACMLSCFSPGSNFFFFPGPTFCNPMNRSLPESSVHGILQARILEWVAMPSSRGSSRPRDQTRVSYVSCTGRWVLHHHHHLGSPSFAPFIHNFCSTHSVPLKDHRSSSGQ